MQFLMGLHDRFAHIRGQVLRTRPLPNADEAFNTVKEEESLSIGHVPMANAMVMNLTRNPIEGREGVIAASYAPRNG